MKALRKLGKDMDRSMKIHAHRAAKEALMEEHDRINVYMDAAVLYALHDAFGFGETRLKRFYSLFLKVHRDFVDAFKSDEDEERMAAEIEDDMAGYYLSELKKIGVDVAAWRQEEKELIERGEI